MQRLLLLYHEERAIARTTECDIIKMNGCLNSLYFSANIEILDFCSEVGNRGVCRVVSTEDLNSFFDEIRFINVID